MIKLKKAEVPEPLAQKIEERTKQLLALLASNEEIPDSLQHPYRHPEVKALIKGETFEKCAYCESKITHVDFGDVEHILPKSLFPQLTYHYGNLTFACSICNNNKRGSHNPSASLINPSEDDPEQEFLALGFFVTRQPERERAEITEHRLELNRPRLIEQRRERLEKVQLLADRYFELPSGPRRDLLLAALHREAEDDNEYA